MTEIGTKKLISEGMQKKCGFQKKRVESVQNSSCFVLRDSSFDTLAQERPWRRRGVWTKGHAGVLARSHKCLLGQIQQAGQRESELAPSPRKFRDLILD